MEIVEMVEAFSHEEQRRDDIENQRLSWLASHLMNATGNYRKRISPTDLYKPLDFVDRQSEDGVIERFESKEQKEEYLENLKKKFGK